MTDIQDMDMTEEQVQQLESNAIVRKTSVDKLQVVDQQTWDAMEALKETLKEDKAMASETMEPMIKEAHKKHKRLTGIRKRWLTPIDAAIKEANRKQDVYSVNEQRKIDAERIRREAEERAEIERQEEAHRKAIADAQENNTPPPPPLPEPEPSFDTIAEPLPVVPTRKGARKTYYAEITDISLLFTAYAAGDVKFPAVDLNDLNKIVTALHLNDMARALKENMQIPGVKVNFRMSQ